MYFDKQFFKNKKVLITGHTGFKGTWLCKILLNFGAKIIGFSNTNNFEFYKRSGVDQHITSIIGDICDFDALFDVFWNFQPQIVIHLAAQPIVLKSYKDPYLTYKTNVLGTINVCECVRLIKSVKSFLNVTTDKVYKNLDIKNYHFKEDDALNGFDPYSNSKSCSDLITSTYRNCFLKDDQCGVSTVRAGNVIGGGDFAEHRIIPDCVKAILSGQDVIIRNPDSIRPYQHVLDALFAYLSIVYAQYNDPDTFSSSYNVGPNRSSFISTKKLVGKLLDFFPATHMKIQTNAHQPREAKTLQLNISKMKEKLNWKPVWKINQAIYEVAQFILIWQLNVNAEIQKEMDREINIFMEDARLC